MHETCKMIFNSCNANSNIDYWPSVLLPHKTPFKSSFIRWGNQGPGGWVTYPKWEEPLDGKPGIEPRNSWFFRAISLTLPQLQGYWSQTLGHLSALWAKATTLHLMKSLWSRAQHQLTPSSVMDLLESFISSDCFLRSQKVESNCLQE